MSRPPGPPGAPNPDAFLVDDRDGLRPTAPDPAPRWRRRKDARPAEIVTAAFQVFSEKGFAAARLDEIAARAGVSKGALYLYFSDKEALFRAVVRDAVAPNVAALTEAAERFEGRFADLLRMFLPGMARMVRATGAGAVAKIVIGESRNFPDLARPWHDEVASRGLGALTRLIERARDRGEIDVADARSAAYSIVGPMVVGVIWNETFAPAGAAPVDLERLAESHVETVLSGLLAVPTEPVR